MQSRVEGTPFVIGSVDHLNDSVATEIRAAIDAVKPGQPTMIFLFGKREHDLQDSHLITFDMSQSEIPDGMIYAKFRRHALLHLKQEMLRHPSCPRIVLLTNTDSDILAYLVVRWIVDELGQPLEAAIRAFTSSWPSGIRMKRTFRALYDLYAHDSSASWYFGNIARYVDPPVALLDLGEENPALPPLTDEQLKILEKSPFISKFPRPEELHIVKPSQPNPPSDFVVSTRRTPSLDRVGVPVETRSCAWMISCLNRKLNRISTTPPMVPMKLIDSSTVTALTENPAVFSAFPLPQGVRCILHIHEGCSFIISEKGIGRQISCELEVSGQNVTECTIEAYLCDLGESMRGLVLSDIILLGDTDLRASKYSDRLEILAGLRVTASDFPLETIRSCKLAEYEQMFLPGQVSFPVEGLYLASLDSTSDCDVFFWKNLTNSDPVVLLRFLPDEKKFVGLVNDRISMRPIVDFGDSVSGAADGDLVDLKFSHKEQKWHIVGTSTAERPWTYATFSKLSAVPPLSFGDLKTELGRLIESDARYNCN